MQTTQPVKQIKFVTQSFKSLFVDRVVIAVSECVSGLIMLSTPALRRSNDSEYT